MGTEYSRGLPGQARGVQDPRGLPEEDIKPDEIHRWAEEFQVSPEELRVAIERVGPVSSEVRKFLENGRAGAP
jgi:hypothetical protein